MATMTMSTKISSIPAAIPSSNRLLPSNDTAASHPPIFLKLNANVLNALSQASSDSQIKLIVSNRNVAFRIDDKEYSGAQYKEPGHVEVYTPERPEIYNNCFRNVGEIRNRFHIKSEKFTKVVADEQKSELEQLEKRLIQLLSVRAQTSKSLVAKTQASINQVRSILAKIADTAGGDLFELKKIYIPAKDQQQQQQQQPTQTTKGTGKDTANGHDPMVLKPARDSGSLSQKKLDLKSSSAAGQRDSKKTLKRQGKREAITEDTSLSSGPSTPHSNGTSSSSSSLSSGSPNGSAKGLTNGSIKRKPVSTTDESSKRQKKDDVRQNMFDLARKFQEAYGEYLELYSVLSKRKSRPASQVQKLMAMHTQLSQWKKTLWSNARSKSQVN